MSDDGEVEAVGMGGEERARDVGIRKEEQESTHVTGIRCTQRHVQLLVRQTRENVGNLSTSCVPIPHPSHQERYTH
jgi:hypothetical protein